jgi:dTDP-glucose 4,6-dehydratase
MDLVIKKGMVGAPYNIGGNEKHANLNIMDRLCASVDGVFATNDSLNERFPNAPAAPGMSTPTLITMVRDRPGHDWRYAIDAGRIQSELGFTSAHDFASGLHSTVDWMLANEGWWCDIFDDSYRRWIEDQYETR